MQVFKLTKSIITLLLLITAAFAARSQEESKPTRPEVSLDTTAIERFSFSGLGSQQAFLKMDYGKSDILNPSSIDPIKDRLIEKVQLVYTQYPITQDLSKLNQKRLDRLYELWPELFDSGLTQWELVTQTAPRSAKEASGMFHGFVINYREPASYSGSLSGAKKMELLMEGQLAPQDSTILKILGRKKEWKDILVVADLTGSMSPYIGQLLLWMKLNSKTRPAKYFVFFNDGDDKSDFEKEIGKTGGIYHSDTTNIRELLELAKETMRNGYGGDEPENNIEALIFGIKTYPKFKEVIMIADNWATPRDLALMKEVKVPVRVVLCGTSKGINPKYLDVARYTKGSVHTIEDDLERLMEMGEGEAIQIGEKLYRIKEGRFKLIR